MNLIDEKTFRNIINVKAKYRDNFKAPSRKNVLRCFEICP